MRDCDVGQNNPEDWINENKNVNHESHFQISVIITILKYICLLDWFDTVLLLETYQLIVVDKELKKSFKLLLLSFHWCKVLDLENKENHSCFMLYFL